MSRIAIVKADKARAVEDLLIRMAQGGQVRSKITEKQLIELLEQVNQQTKTETKIVVSSRHVVRLKPDKRDRDFQQQCSDDLPMYPSSSTTVVDMMTRTMMIMAFKFEKEGRVCILGMKNSCKHHKSQPKLACADVVQQQPLQAGLPSSPVRATYLAFKCWHNSKLYFHYI